MKYKTRPDQRSIGTILWQKKHYLTIYFLTKTKQQQRNTTLSTHFNYDEPKQPLLHWEEVETKNNKLKHIWRFRLKHVRVFQRNNSRCICWFGWIVRDSIWMPKWNWMEPRTRSQSFIQSDIQFREPSILIFKIKRNNVGERYGDS